MGAKRWCQENFDVSYGTTCVYEVRDEVPETVPDKLNAQSIPVTNAPGVGLPDSKTTAFHNIDSYINENTLMKIH